MYMVIWRSWFRILYELMVLELVIKYILVWLTRWDVAILLKTLIRNRTARWSISIDNQ